MQCTRFWVLFTLHQGIAKAQLRLCICTGWPEPSLLACIHKVVIQISVWLQIQGSRVPSRPGPILSWRLIMIQFIQSFSSLPLIHSGRVVVSYKQKYVHEVLVNCLFKLAQERMRWTDRPGVPHDHSCWLGCKATKPPPLPPPPPPPKKKVGMFCMEI